MRLESRLPARVIVMAKSGGYMLLDDDLGDSNGAYYSDCHTDANGRFKLPAQDEPYDLLVLDESGYARISCREFSKSDTIRLNQWSSIQGRVYEDGKPASDVLMYVQDEFGQPDDNADIGYLPNAKTDTDGHFVFHHVPAGRHAVGRSVEFADQGNAGEQSKTIAINSDEAVELNFGLGGQTITGIAVLPTGVPSNTRFGMPSLIRIEHPTTAPSREAWSPKTLSRNTSVAYEFQPRADGSFRIPAVEPGEYSLIIQAVQPMWGSYCGYGDIVAKYIRKLTIQSGGSTPLDLGKCALSEVERLTVCSAAPDFEYSDRAGKTRKLSDSRGKYVLLAFWASWCAPAWKNSFSQGRP